MSVLIRFAGPSMKMQSGLVSVMMPAYNAERTIREAIESLLAQRYRHWELIIVDDGSTDGTAAVAASFDDLRITVIRQPNGGEAAARNEALRHMQGEFVAFLDADDSYLPHHLEVTTAYLQDHPDRDGVYTDGYYCDQDGVYLKSLSSRRAGPCEGRLFEKAVYASNVFGPPVCVLLRRHLITQHSLAFDEDIVIGPDWLFFIQYADLGEFGYVNEPTCLYRVHPHNITARVGLQRRALELAKCRMRTIEMENFKTCSVETRTAVFYDLLVNLLKGYPDQQSAITQHPQFLALPADQQARLFRLMASKAIIGNCPHLQYIDEWLRRSREINPADLRGLLLTTAYLASPRFCRWLLTAKTRRQLDPLTMPPLADLQGALSGTHR